MPAKRVAGILPLGMAPAASLLPLIKCSCRIVNTAMLLDYEAVYQSTGACRPEERGSFHCLPAWPPVIYSLSYMPDAPATEVADTLAGDGAARSADATMPLRLDAGHACHSGPGDYSFISPGMAHLAANSDLHYFGIATVGRTCSVMLRASLPLILPCSMRANFRFVV